jgi:PAS domain S-box-containing protein
VDVTQNDVLRFRLMVESLPAATYATDAAGYILYYNKAAAELWGREPVIGVDLWCGSHKILHADGSLLSPDACPMAICLKEQRAVPGMEIQVVRPDGSVRHVSPQPQPIFDDHGKMIGAVNILTDITELKRKEARLRESEVNSRNMANALTLEVEVDKLILKRKTEELKISEQRYHKMIEEVEDYAILLLNSEGIIQNWNKGAEKIKGYKEEEIVGKSFIEFYLMEDRKQGLPLQLLEEARINGKAIHEGWRKRKDNTIFWGSIVLTALHDDENNVIGFSKVTRDLTERKLAEDQVKNYLNQLKFQNDELNQFVFAASHDLKEPLRKIQLYNDFIAGHTGNVLDDKSKDFLRKSVNATRRMNDLIEDLLTYSRQTVSNDSAALISLHAIAEDIILHLNNEFDTNQVQIIVDPLPMVTAVGFQIKQLFINLINNSIKYKHPARNVVIHLFCREVLGKEIDLPLGEQEKKFYAICFEDNGIGFEPKYAEKIFEIFQRLNTTGGTSGSGIGLAICKKIVLNHNGFIKAVGIPDKGASFWVYLPKPD